jgi:hypothetical protein
MPGWLQRPADRLGLRENAATAGQLWPHESYHLSLREAASGHKSGFGLGALQVWKHVQALFPSAIQILDDDHWGEHLHRVVALQFGEHPEQRHKWCDAVMARLLWGEKHDVIWDLQRMKPKHIHAAEAVAKPIAYLQWRRERVDYRFARKGGAPIGSGGIESANKCICHVQLNRSGTW